MTKYPSDWPPEYIERAKKNPVKIRGFFDHFDKEMEKLGIPKIKETGPDSENKYTVVFKPFQKRGKKENKSK